MIIRQLNHFMDLSLLWVVEHLSLFFFFLVRDLLFSQVYDKMSENSVAKGVFLECLEPYILSGKLIGMTAQVMKDLLLHFQDRNLLENMEACIVHMDITSLDIQQVNLSRKILPGISSEQERAVI